MRKLRLCAGLTALIAASFPGALARNEPVAAVPEVLLVDPAAMPSSDAHTATASQGAIAESSQFYGYTLDSSYSYKEIACPLTPDHLLLAYEATLPSGAVSRFTVVLAKGRAGTQERVEIIPILRFGAVPFMPANTNPHSFEIFNRVVSPALTGRETVAGLNAGEQPLLVRSLCFMAMIGEPTSVLHASALDPVAVHAPPPTVQFAEKEQMRQVFSVKSGLGAYRVWTLTYSSAGKLLSAQAADFSGRESHPTQRAGGVPSAPALAQAGSGTAAGSAVVNTAPEPLTATSAPASGAASSGSSVPVSSPATNVNASAVGKDSEAAAPPAHSPPAANVEMPAAAGNSANDAMAGHGATANSSSQASIGGATVTAPAVQPVVAPEAIGEPQNTSSAASNMATPPVSVPQHSHRMSTAVVETAPGAALAPMPPSRFIPDAPAPKGRIIPDASLQTPPRAP